MYLWLEGAKKALVVCAGSAVTVVILVEFAYHPLVSVLKTRLIVGQALMKFNKRGAK